MPDYARRLCGDGVVSGDGALLGWCNTVGATCVSRSERQPRACVYWRDGYGCRNGIFTTRYPVVQARVECRIPPIGCVGAVFTRDFFQLFF